MNSEERIIKTLLHEETDRVPIFEWIIDKKVLEVISPGKTIDEFVYLMDLDAICVDLDYKEVEIESGTYRDEWGIIKKYNLEEHSYPMSGPINNLNDLKKYEPPDPIVSDRYRTLDEKLKKHSGKKAVILHLNDVFSTPLRLLGFESMLRLFYDEPELVHGVIEISKSINLEMAKQAKKRGVKIIYTADDYAFKMGPLLTPNQFKEFLFKPMCDLIKGFKELGLYVIKHTDGDIMSLIEMIIDTGIDCLDPIDPSAGMSLEYIKKTYGSRIAIKGNVNCATTLQFGTVEEVIKETKLCLEIGSPGGGYILSSSNSIHSGVKPENFKAMIETHKKYGYYKNRII